MSQQFRRLARKLQRKDLPERKRRRIMAALQADRWFLQRNGYRSPRMDPSGITALLRERYGIGEYRSEYAIMRETRPSKTIPHCPSAKRTKHAGKREVKPQRNIR